MSRIRLHKHLFTSLFFHALVSSLLKWYMLTNSESQYRSVATASSSILSLLCLLLSILLRYFRSTTYLWMFNEALYLHQLIKNAFTQPPLTPLIILAYFLPLTTTTVYILIRSLSNGLNINSTNESLMAHNLSETFRLQLEYRKDRNRSNNKFNDSYFDNVFEVIDEYEDVSPLIEEDKCWLMPAQNSWLEWIINAPNLAILIVSTFSITIYARHQFCILLRSSFSIQVVCTLFTYC